MMLPEVSAETTRRRYRGPIAASYEVSRQDRGKWTREHTAVSDFLKDATGTVLDVPVGTGRFLLAYQRLGLRAIGIDVSADMLDVARQKETGADLRLGDAFSIDMPDRSVETVVCVRLLNLMTEIEMLQALREVARVARDRLVLSIRLRENRHRKKQSWTHRRCEFERAVAGHGLRISGVRMCERPDYSVILLER